MGSLWLLIADWLWLLNKLLYLNCFIKKLAVSLTECIVKFCHGDVNTLLAKLVINTFVFNKSFIVWDKSAWDIYVLQLKLIFEVNLPVRKRFSWCCKSLGFVEYFRAIAKIRDFWFWWLIIIICSVLCLVSAFPKQKTIVYKSLVFLLVLIYFVLE